MVRTLLQIKRNGAPESTANARPGVPRKEVREVTSKLKWKADLEKHCITTSFDRRNWERVDEGGYTVLWDGFNDCRLLLSSGEQWNIYWASVYSTRLIFNGEAGYRLKDSQIINHFPNHYELTRKDLMVKNIKRYRKDMEKEGREFRDILPRTFVLPVDYSLFVEEFRKAPHSKWIMKPTSKARGQGIFLVSKLSQVKKWSNNASNLNAGSTEVYVISRYIERPLLIGDKKFDLRLYVLVTSYKPLEVYFYKDGFARFCNTKYSTQACDLGNQYVHLTNVSIQKHDEDYNANHGNKLSLTNLKLYLTGKYGSKRTEELFTDIKDIIITSCRAVKNVMINDKHCFECYGYDVIIDQDLKPWLVEVNASPSLTATTESDRAMKKELLHEIFKIVLPPKSASDVRPISSRFEILLDGSEEAEYAQDLKWKGKRRLKTWR